MTEDIPPEIYRELFQCFLSDQISAKQWQEHLEDEVFAAWVAREMRKRQG